MFEKFMKTLTIFIFASYNSIRNPGRNRSQKSRKGGQIIPFWFCCFSTIPFRIQILMTSNDHNLKIKKFSFKNRENEVKSSLFDFAFFGQFRSGFGSNPKVPKQTFTIFSRFVIFSFTKMSKWHKFWRPIFSLSKVQKTKIKISSLNSDKTTKITVFENQRKCLIQYCDHCDQIEYL